MISLAKTTLASLIVLSMSCTSSLQMHSEWRESEIRIDGDFSDWQGRLTYVEDKKISIGFVNDQDNLYIGITTSDRALQRKIMGMGMTVWLDKKGGKDKQFGIKFPVGLMSMGMMPRRGAGPDMEGIQDAFEESLQKLELFPPGEEESRFLSYVDATGIEVKIGGYPEDFYYEMKVPLYRTNTTPFALEIADKAVVGVGLETSQIDREQMRAARAGPGFGGSGPPDGDGMPPGGGGRGGMPGGGNRGAMMEPFKLWLLLELIEESAIPSAEMMRE